ncbi:AAA family ATPase [Bradyrhizobium sp. 215_C5_N1_1]|uniref:AAA family ATPase n=1 Tax=unclassified Bradyrhizobium TaxID=2631580 RepID=UPI003F89B2EC
MKADANTLHQTQGADRLRDIIDLHAESYVSGSPSTSKTSSPLSREQARQAYADVGFSDGPPPFDAPFHDYYPESADGEPIVDAAPAGPVAILGEWNAGAATRKPPPRGWLLGNQFCRQFISGLAAPGATGKSAVRQAQYIALATGKPITGQHVFKRGRVLQISLEDDADEMRRRLAAACIYHGIEPADLDGWLFCATPKGIKLAEMKDGSARRGPLEMILRKTIEDRKIDLLALDPLIKLHALKENDNNDMDFVSEILATLASEYNIAVDIPMHTKKGMQTAGDTDAGRGAGATRDGGRLMNTLTRMNEEEGKAYGIPAEQRSLYVRLDNAKVNLAPPSDHTTWFKLVGVQLDNGTPDYPAGDTVQTVVPWHPPKTWDGISSAQLNAALDEIEAGMPNGQRYSDASKAGARAAWPVVQKHCPDRTEPQCREILRTWNKNGVTYSEDYDDAIDRKSRKGLRVCHAKRPS